MLYFSTQLHHPMANHRMTNYFNERYIRNLNLNTVKPVKLDTLWFQSKVSNIVECPTFQGLDTCMGVRPFPTKASKFQKCPTFLGVQVNRFQCIYLRITFYSSSIFNLTTHATCIKAKAAIT